MSGEFKSYTEFKEWFHRQPPFQKRSGEQPSKDYHKRLYITEMDDDKQFVDGVYKQMLKERGIAVRRYDITGMKAYKLPKEYHRKFKSEAIK